MLQGPRRREWEAADGEAVRCPKDPGAGSGRRRMARRCEGCGGRGVLHGGRWREVVGGRSGADERGGADGCCGAGRGDAWYYKADDGAVTHGTTRRTTARAARGGVADSGGDGAEGTARARYAFYSPPAIGRLGVWSLWPHPIDEEPGADWLPRSCTDPTEASGGAAATLNFSIYTPTLLLLVKLRGV
jgi:hypothetical protein